VADRPDVPTVPHPVLRAYRLLVDDLTGRPRLGRAWCRLDDEERADIKDAWSALLERQIRAAVLREQRRCLEIVRTHARDAASRIEHPDLFRSPDAV
jgi:hypothetical protein